jgi:[acyl-carrier-protein] S-malonyltransferase
MGRDLADAYTAARQVFECVDATLGVPLSRLCFEGPADELMMTDNAQPALFTHSAAVWAVVRDRAQASLRAAAGHSLGELTAYHAVGALTLEDGARLVRRRGALMRRAGEERPGAMAAIIGELAISIDVLCAEATAEVGEVVAANYNTAEQTVISGEVAGVEFAMALAKRHGAKRALRLPVSGAFHSPLMQPSAVGLEEALAAAAFSDARVPVYSNVDTEPSYTADSARTRLLQQLTSPVRWLEIVTRLASDFPQALFVEMGSGAVLTGLTKRIAPGVATMTCGTPSEVEDLLGRLS